MLNRIVDGCKRGGRGPRGPREGARGHGDRPQGPREPRESRRTLQMRAASTQAGGRQGPRGQGTACRGAAGAGIRGEMRAGGSAETRGRAWGRVPGSHGESMGRRGSGARGLSADVGARGACLPAAAGLGAGAGRGPCASYQLLFEIPRRRPCAADAGPLQIARGPGTAAGGLYLYIETAVYRDLARDPEGRGPAGIWEGRGSAAPWGKYHFEK